jgi:hypothetical protein
MESTGVSVSQISNPVRLCRVACVCRPALMHLNPLTYLACVGKAANCKVVYHLDARIHCDTNHGFSASKDLIFASVCS